MNVLPQMSNYFVLTSTVPLFLLCHLQGDNLVTGTPQCKTDCERIFKCAFLFRSKGTPDIQQVALLVLQEMVSAYIYHKFIGCMMVYM